MIRFIESSFLYVKSPVEPNHYWPVVAAAVVVPYALYKLSFSPKGEQNPASTNISNFILEDIKTLMQRNPILFLRDEY